MRRHPAVVLFILVSVVGVTACGGDSEPSPAQKSGSDTTTSTPPPTALAPTDGRLGDAVRATAEDPVEEILDRGGEIPDAIAEDPTGETGVGAASGCADSQLDVSAATLRRVSRATFCLLNAERRKKGLPALKQQRRLARASIAHSKDMVRRQYFAHESPSGRKVVDRLRAVGYIPRTRSWTIGENLAWGSGALARPEAIVAAWIASPPHRENLLSPRYSSVGMGVVLGTPAGSADEGATFTTNFGRIG